MDVDFSCFPWHWTVSLAAFITVTGYSSQNAPMLYVVGPRGHRSVEGNGQEHVAKKQWWIANPANSWSPPCRIMHLVYAFYKMLCSCAVRVSAW